MLTAQSRTISKYILATWGKLTRSNRGLAAAAVDPKFLAGPDGRWPVYIPVDESLPRLQGKLRRLLPDEDFKKIVVRQLPTAPGSHGLLFLPYRYVVPGGRFNEMYGWDSYFIQLGLLRDNLMTLAKAMADNCLYQVRHYGKILNANRTYYMGRSQPPFLTAMVLGVYRKTLDKHWVQTALPQIEAYYHFWTSGDRLTASGLSRYWDSGEGPAPEAAFSERDAAGHTHYFLVKEYFRTHQIPDYDVSDFYDEKHDELTPLFYKGDRAMRESGFDPSHRFGPFSADITRYNPVCLNSLLYLMELQLGEIFNILDLPAIAAQWRKKAVTRASLVNQLLWDESTGLYLDYNYVKEKRRNYPFLTTFFPLWTGIATPQQARHVAANLPLFEQIGGLQTSTHRSGNQWDAPFGWAPLQMIAVQGLRRYGFNADADRISEKFLSLVRDEYRRTGTIVEKYDVVQRGADVEHQIHYGYRTNEVGFGWTNAVFEILLDELPASVRRRVMAN